MSAQFIQSPHIISMQFQQEQEMLQECTAQKWSFEKPYIKVNPYIIAPLTALIHFTTEQEESIDIAVKGKKNALVHTFRTPSRRNYQH